MAQSDENGKNQLDAVVEQSKSSLKGFTKWKEAVFLTGVAGASIIFGFGTAVSSAKKKDPEFFGKGMTPALRMETGGSLAMRALGWGTIYAVTGCGILFYSIWKVLGVQNLEEFRLKVGNILPAIPKNSPPQGRTEFENLTDLLQYLIDEDKRKKSKSSSQQSVQSSIDLKQDSSEKSN